MGRGGWERKAEGGSLVPRHAETLSRPEKKGDELSSGLHPRAFSSLELRHPWEGVYSLYGAKQPSVNREAGLDGRGEEREFGFY